MLMQLVNVKKKHSHAIVVLISFLLVFLFPPVQLYFSRSIPSCIIETTH